MKYKIIQYESEILQKQILIKEAKLHNLKNSL
jgi:hypothetical protein